MKTLMIVAVFVIGICAPASAMASRTCLFPGEVADAKGFCAVPAKAVKPIGKHHRRVHKRVKVT